MATWIGGLPQNRAARMHTGGSFNIREGNLVNRDDETFPIFSGLGSMQIFFCYVLPAVFKHLLLLSFSIGGQVLGLYFILGLIEAQEQHAVDAANDSSLGWVLLGWGVFFAINLLASLVPDLYARVASRGPFSPAIPYNYARGAVRSLSFPVMAWLMMLGGAISVAPEVPLAALLVGPWLMNLPGTWVLEILIRSNEKENPNFALA